ncbi:MAG TPA: hypothetical protein VGU43_03805, partial [Thermoplasmata archaeon]|nr:hypothetical protein [Thermoplasmata archaeon]
ETKADLRPPTTGRPRVSAKRGAGLDELRHRIEAVLRRVAPARPAEGDDAAAEDPAVDDPAVEDSGPDA